MAVGTRPPANLDAHDDATPQRHTGVSRTLAWLRVPWVACLVLLAAYVGLSALNDPRGTLLADSGGKLATMRVMEQRGALDPDLGYWASADDPDGDLHPLQYTKRVGSGYVQATTLPMLFASAPLYSLGGTRAALLLPMLGGVVSALAARALARRLGAGEGAGWLAFWAVGLVTPVVIYATSFWEHSLGLAALLWAIVLALDVVEGRGSSWRALAVGALFGVAITLRGEALVYAAVTATVACGTMVLRRVPWRRLVATGSAALAGIAAVVAANHVLEVRALGGAVRTTGSSAVAGAAGDAGRGLADRIGEAFTSLAAVNGFATSIDTLVGATLAGLVCLSVWSLAGARRSARLAAVAGALAVLLYLVRFGAGIGYIPGLLVASPLAAVGVVAVWRRSSLRLVGLLALAPLPIIWLTQYAGSQRFQWASRYALTSGALLAVAAIVALRHHRAALTAALGFSLLVTGFGVVFVAERSHSIAGGMEMLVARGDEVLVSVEPHLLREGGDFYRSDRRWLTATTATELERAARIADRHGAREIAVVGPARLVLPDTLGGYRRHREQRLRVRPEEALRVVEYHAE